jgi:hypothetical protein
MARYDQYHLSQVQQLAPRQQFYLGVIDRSVFVYRKVLFIVPTAAVALLVTTLILIAAPN